MTFAGTIINHHKSKCSINIYRDFIIMAVEDDVATNWQLHAPQWPQQQQHQLREGNHIWHAWESHTELTTFSFIFMAGKFCTWQRLALGDSNGADKKRSRAVLESGLISCRPSTVIRPAWQSRRKRQDATESTVHIAPIKHNAMECPKVDLKQRLSSSNWGAAKPSPSKKLWRWGRDGARASEQARTRHG